MCLGAAGAIDPALGLSFGMLPGMIVGMHWKKEAKCRWQIMKNPEQLVQQLTAPKASDGCDAMKQLLAISEESNRVYPFLARFLDLLNHDHSYVRTRALLLIAANAKWDSECQIDENLDKILAHVTDPKPITARQFIQSLPALAAAKPDLRKEILDALRRADSLRYSSSMRPLIDADIRRATLAICLEENAKQQR